MKFIQDFLTINPFSRKGEKLHDVALLIWHWVANPGASDTAIGKYFERLKNQNPNDDILDRYASAHFTVDDDSATQHIPVDEVAYHVGARKYSSFAIEKLGPKYTNNAPYTPNFRTLGIEICHPTWDGYFSQATIQNLYRLSAGICKKFNLDPETQIARHYDITGKICPKYYVEHSVEYERLKYGVKVALQQNDILKIC